MRYVENFSTHWYIIQPTENWCIIQDLQRWYIIRTNYATLGKYEQNVNSKIFERIFEKLLDRTILL